MREYRNKLNKSKQISWVGLSQCVFDRSEWEAFKEESADSQEPRLPQMIFPLPKACRVKPTCTDALHKYFVFLWIGREPIELCIKQLQMFVLLFCWNQICICLLI